MDIITLIVFGVCSLVLVLRGVYTRQKNKI